MWKCYFPGYFAHYTNIINNLTNTTFAPSSVNILISAFSCLPNRGSEPGVAWRWTKELAKKHRVIVLTDSTRRADIESEMATNPIKNVEFAFYRPIWLKRFPLNSKTAPVLYSLWQYSIYPFARALHRQHHFDLVIHLTYGVFRQPSFLGFLGPPFVFGPVGGGEDAPWRLKHSLPVKEKAKEILRTAFNRISALNPMLWVALSKATLILVRTPETARCMPSPFSKRAVLQREIGIDACGDSCRAQHERDVRLPLKVLFVGRLLGWKGVHLALRAIQAASVAGYSLQLTIVGAGPCRDWLHQLSNQLGIDNVVHWVDHLPQDELFDLYAKHDCFLFPSLHDSSGNVVLEAQAFGLPVICLDLGGPATLVSRDSAVVIDTHSKTEHEVVQDLSTVLAELSQSELKRRAMSAAALLHTQRMSWDALIDEVIERISQRTGI